MVMPLLTTKLNTPPPRPAEHTVSRPHLLERLDAGLRLGRKLTLVSAPAGFGKTTLIASWAGTLASGSPAGSRVAWLSLDTSDDDTVRFWSYAIAALQTIRPGLGEAALTLLRAQPPAPSDSVLTELLNQIAATAVRLVLVLDDYHLMASPTINESMAFLLDHLPPQLHLVILTRADPPLPLARLRAGGQLTELRAADLSFSVDETAVFFEQVMGLDLTGDHVVALQTRAEGWIAGLQLAALSMQGRTNISDFIAEFAGTHHYIVDYLVEQVLHDQPPHMRSFLLQTSLLDRLCGPLCDFLTERDDSQATLEALQRANLFVVSLDDARFWYRYHHLFADMLRNRLQATYPGRLETLHRRAAAWYTDAQQVEPAIEHTFATGDFTRVRQLLRHFYPQWLSPENRGMIDRWFERFPQESLSADPWLCVVWAWLVWAQGKAAEAENLLNCAQTALDRMQHDGTLPQNDFEYDVLPAEILAFRALIISRKNIPTRAIELAQRSLAIAPQNANTIVAIAYLAQQVAYRDLGQMDEAVRACRLALPAARAGDEVGTQVSICHSLGYNLSLQGKLREAAAIYQDGLRHAEMPGTMRSSYYGIIYVRLAELYYERNDLQQATRLLEQGLEVSHQTAYLWPRFFGFSLLTRLRLVTGDRHGALDAMEQLEPLSARIIGAYFEHKLRSYWARLSAELGQRRRAETLAKSFRPTLDERSGYDQIDQAVQLAHTLVALGRLDEGLEWASLTQSAIQVRQYGHWQIAMSVLQAATWQAKGDESRALRHLEQALRLAEPEGYVRTFLDHGPPIFELLLKASRRGIFPTYTRMLLSAVPSGAATVPQPLIEPLSERELQVLGLLADGKSNQAIGDELFIAVGTVKKHLSNIFGKLGVRNRTECAARARELGLIQARKPPSR